MIDDRMRGPGNGTTTVWVYDERRRVRDDVAGRLVALPFVGRVEVIGDPASLLSRLATRQPDVLLVGTQRAVDSGLTAATQVLRAHPGLPVLVLGAPDDADTVRAAVAFGARGYLRWDASHIEMGLGLSRRRPARRGRPPIPAQLSAVGASCPGLERRRPAGRLAADHGALHRPRARADRPVDARDAGAHRHEPGQEQRPDRPRALPVRGHHQDPRPPAVPQAGRQGPRRGGGHRLPPRA